MMKETLLILATFFSRFSIVKFIIGICLLCLYLWLIFFKQIEVVAPGEGISSIKESNVVIKAPESAYVVSINVSQGVEVVPAQSMLVYRNLDDEYQLSQIIESLLKDSEQYTKLHDEWCFLHSKLFSETSKISKENKVDCALADYTGGAGGQLILQYYEDYLLEKTFFNELKVERQRRKSEFIRKRGVLLKKRKALLRGRGETLRFYDLDVEISNLKSEMIVFEIGTLENKKKVKDKYSTFQLSRSERLLSLDEKINQLKTKIIEKNYQRDLLKEKLELSVIKSPIKGNVLKMTDGLAVGTFIEAASPLFVLKKNGASKSIDAKFNSRYRHFLHTGKKVTLKIDSPGVNLIYKGVIAEVSSDSIEYDEPGKSGQRYYRVDIRPEKAFIDKSLNLGLDVQVIVIANQITAFDYISSVIPGAVNFNVW